MFPDWLKEKIIEESSHYQVNPRLGLKHKTEVDNIVNGTHPWARIAKF